METIQKRQIAYKVRISNLKEGEYVKETGWLPNYILFNGKKISRINLIGIVVIVNENGKEFFLEDKSGRILIRNFEDKDYGVNVGDFVAIIGRPREFNNEIYVVPEIVKFVDRDWLKLRELELCFNDENNISKNCSDEPCDKKERDKITEEIIKDSIDPEEVIKQIKILDKGEGADYEELLSKIKNEKIIRSLLEEGEIFEIKPGKLKIL